MSVPNDLLRAVVDTNLYFSGTILRRGNPFELLQAWNRDEFVVLVSAHQRAETADVFGRPRVLDGYGVTEDMVAGLLARLTSVARPVVPMATLPLDVRERKDNPILAAALGGDADFLVTGDKDLLALAGDPRLGRLRIVTVAEFLAVLRARRQGEPE